MGTNFRRRTRRRRRRRRRRRSRGGRIITKNDPDPPKYGDCRPPNKKGQDWCWTKDGVKKGVDGWSMKGNKQGNKSKQGNKQGNKGNQGNAKQSAKQQAAEAIKEGVDTALSFPDIFLNSCILVL